MENRNSDTLTLARVLHGAQVERGATVEALEASLQEALAAVEQDRLRGVVAAGRRSIGVQHLADISFVIARGLFTVRVDIMIFFT